MSIDCALCASGRKPIGWQFHTHLTDTAHAYLNDIDDAELGAALRGLLTEVAA